MRKVLTNFSLSLFCLLQMATNAQAGIYPINEEPVQTVLVPSQRFNFKKANIEAVAQYHIHAKVLKIHKYGWDHESKFAPIDYAVGWGAMSDPQILKAFHITQSGRWYYWKSNNMPISKSEVTSHSANMHLIPAAPDVHRRLAATKEGETITLEGYLVNINDNGWKWNSSLSRNDSGAHSCELMYVTRASY